MNVDQELYEKARCYLCSVIEDEGDFSDKLKYLYFLRDLIDQYMEWLEEREPDDVPWLDRHK